VNVQRATGSVAAPQIAACGGAQGVVLRLSALVDRQRFNPFRHIRIAKTASDTYDSAALTDPTGGARSGAASQSSSSQFKSLEEAQRAAQPQPYADWEFDGPPSSLTRDVR
jgi:hypothetical protein